MKKIMLACAAVAIAAVAQAATVTWTLTNVYNAKGDALVSTTTAAYLFTTDKAALDSWSTLTSAEDLADKAATGYALTATADGKYSNTTYTDISTLGLGLTQGKSYDFYAIVIDGDNYYITKGGTVTTVAVPDSTENVLIGFGSQKNYTMAGGSSYTGWTAVPEPTSGLLLLLGMAGLALKRKIA